MKKIKLNEIIKILNNSDYEGLIYVIGNWLRLNIKLYYNLKNEKIDDLVIIFEKILQKVISKILYEFVPAARIIRYILQNQYEIGDIFSPEEIYDLVEDHFYYKDRIDLSKSLYSLTKSKSPMIIKVKDNKFKLISKSKENSNLVI